MKTQDRITLSPDVMGARPCIRGMEAFTRHGTLAGRVQWVSPDAIADEKLGPVYQARIHVDPPAPAVAATGVVVSPGLAATAEIKTARRRVIDYLLSPLERRLNEAGRER